MSAQVIQFPEKLVGHPMFYELLKKMAEVHSAKNHDYAMGGDPLSNFKLAGAFGVPPFVGVMVRMSDKWSRLISLIQKGRAGNPEVKEESIEDTLLDLANYALLAIILLREGK